MEKLTKGAGEGGGGGGSGKDGGGRKNGFESQVGCVDGYEEVDNR